MAEENYDAVKPSDVKRLRAACKAVGVNSFGKKMPAILKEFMDAVDAKLEAEKVPDDQVRKVLGGDVVDSYNDVLKQLQSGAPSSGEDVKAPVKGKKVSPVSKKAVKGDAKPKKMAGEVAEKVGLSRYGHRAGSQAAQLDDIFFKGSTSEKAAADLGVAESRVKSHISHLRKRGVGITKNEKTGVWSVKS